MAELTQLMLSGYILWQVNRLSTPGAKMNLPHRLLVLWVGWSLFRLIGRAMT